MIDRLEGTVSRTSGNAVYMRVGPATLEVLVPIQADGPPAETGGSLSLWTHLQWKQDEGPVLFGFRSKEERRLFRLLIQVQGIGPRIALAILAHLPPHRLLDRLLAKDDLIFTTVPGVGKKTAGRILVELGPQAEKLALEIRGSVPTPGLPGEPVSGDAVRALEALGYPKRDAETALRQVLTEHSSATVEEQIRSGLRKLTQSPPRSKP